MEIKVKTDFNIGDTIHYMKDNKPTFGIVSTIAIECTQEDRIPVLYRVRASDYIPEGMAFANPYDLRDSLFSEAEEKKN